MADNFTCTRMTDPMAVTVAAKIASEVFWMASTMCSDGGMLARSWSRFCALQCTLCFTSNGVWPHLLPNSAVVITTAEFGRRWGQTPFEVKQSVHCNAQNLDQLRASMPPSLHMVEAIQNTSEAIFAATVTAIGSVILVHVKLSAMRRVVDVVVKSASHEVSVRELAQISRALSGAR